MLLAMTLPAHLDLFAKGIATKLDFSYSGPQSGAIARALASGKIQLGAIHTYIELFARYFVDLTPHVTLIAAVSGDKDGTLRLWDAKLIEAADELRAVLCRTLHRDLTDDEWSRYVPDGVNRRPVCAP